MRTYSIKEASRRLGDVLKDAQSLPVVINYHGRPRAAVVSMKRFELCEKLLKDAIEEMAVEGLRGSIDAARSGRLRTAARLRLMAKSLSGGVD